MLAASVRSIATTVLATASVCAGRGAYFIVNIIIY